MFSSCSKISCCGNATSNGNGSSVFGYWSPVDYLYKFQQSQPVPKNFTAKWIHGHARNNYFPGLLQGASTFEEASTPRLVFREAPSIQALTCLPIIESGDAEITVDSQSGIVLSYTILEKNIQVVERAWTDPFLLHNLTSPPSAVPLSVGVGADGFETEICGPFNITTSYGTLFLVTLLGVADIRGLQEGFADCDTVENLNDMTFNIRDREQGINTDFMSYAMYTSVNKDPTALLNATKLSELTQKTFQTFFQHFVSSNVSVTDGGRAYQPIGTTLGDIGAIVKVNREDIKDTIPENYSNEYPVSNTNRSTTAKVSKRIEVLYMSPVATWLSVSILVWLALTTITAAILQRSHVRSLNSNFDKFADVLVCISGSDNLLELVKKIGIQGLEKETSVLVRLGWFKDRKGMIRYGIEAEGGKDMREVEWVEPMVKT
jgi:hypothetical protein